MTSIPPTSRLRAVRRTTLAIAVASIAATVLAQPGATSTAATTPDRTEVQQGERVSAARASGATRFARLKGYPTETSAGVPRSWTPKRTIERDVWLRKDGQTLRDVRIYGDLYVEADDVTIERVEVVGGIISNLPTDTCYDNTLIKRTTIRRDDQTSDQDYPAIGDGGYTARRVAIIDTAEGFRVSGSSSPYDCGAVRILNSFARVVSPDVCNDWHGDALQGYDGNHLVMRNSVLVMVTRHGCGGTAPFFYPAGQGNTSVDIDGLVVKGGGFPFRLGMPGTVHDLNIVRDSWEYGPIDVMCSAIDSWDAQIVQLVGQGTRARDVRNQRCNTEEGY